jgi:hypothetical protein
MAALLLAGRRARVLGAGAFFFLRIDCWPEGHPTDLTTRGGGAPRAGVIFSPACFFLEQVNERILVSILEVGWIEVA